jgi:hypothetical protein
MTLLRGGSGGREADRVGAGFCTDLLAQEKRKAAQPADADAANPILQDRVIPVFRVRIRVEIAPRRGVNSQYKKAGLCRPITDVIEM